MCEGDPELLTVTIGQLV